MAPIGAMNAAIAPSSDLIQQLQNIMHGHMYK